MYTFLGKGGCVQHHFSKNEHGDLVFYYHFEFSIKFPAKYVNIKINLSKIYKKLPKTSLTTCP